MQFELRPWTFSSLAARLPKLWDCVQADTREEERIQLPLISYVRPFAATGGLQSYDLRVL